ncbi:MAG TPA: hypothetical protein VFG50_17515 [Rhodothermales bacterium]|nr:hypothetical protein [Rhodothermales bacterium]
MEPQTSTLSIPPEVAHRLGYYVYLYVDPRTGKPFYVGKGKGDRVLSHMSEAGESRKLQMIKELRDEGLEPRMDILAHGLRDEETAFRIEAAVIDLIGLDELTNRVRGWRSIQTGRLPLHELIVYYAAKPVKVEVPALLIRINRLYHHNMSAVELYEATRGVWKLGPRREGARYAFAVFEGVVRAVYEITEWHPAATIPYSTRNAEELRYKGRWEFAGHQAPEPIWSHYVDRSVAAYFRYGQQSPVVYVNC